MDESFTRRVKALARTAPVHDLESGKAMRDGDWSSYDLRALSLAAIDTVIDHMGLEHGATSEGVLARLAGLARAAAPDRDPARHRAVAAAVLGALLNDRNRREAFSVPYGEWTGSGERTGDERTGSGERTAAGHRMAELVFKLLEEVEAPDGTIVLRATDEAVNLFVGALDRDVEDAQAAAEAVLASQLRRGRVGQAVHTAKEARLRSVQFTRKVRRILEATRRDVRQVDWGEDVPALLSDSLDHLAERLSVERRLIVTLSDTLERAPEGDDARAAARLVELVRDCRSRHTDLHRELVGARAVFLDEQERQRFGRTAETRLVCLEEDLLKPLLAAPVPVGAPAAAAFLVRSLGPGPPRLLRVADLVAGLLRPRLEAAEPPLFEPPELTELDLDPDRFPEEVRRAAEIVLSSVEARPVRLSKLLESARRSSERAAELVGITALRAFAPESAREELDASDDGTPLDDPAAGGADLVLTRVPGGEEESWD